MFYSMVFKHCLLAAVLGFIIATVNAADTSVPLNTAEIERLTGLKGTYSKEENVFKVSKPRNDIKIRVDEWLCHLSWA